MVFDELMNAIKNKDITVVAQIAPALRVSLNEEFGVKPEELNEGKIVAALKKLGVDKVFDTCVGADIISFSETAELIKRQKNKNNLPLFTTCCPAFVTFIENNFPDLVKHFCHAKSPQAILGALTKTYFAEKNNLKPERIFVVSLMPCLVKKIEAKKPELAFDGVPHTDLVLVTTELGKLLKENKINPVELDEQEFDSLLGHASAGGKIFGFSGGVSEALMRNYENISGKKIKRKSFTEYENVTESIIKSDNTEFKIAFVDGVQHIRPLMNNPEKLKEFDLVECMFCEGGCINGPGQPKADAKILMQRRNALKKLAEKEKHQAAFENPEVKAVFEEFLGKPGSAKACHILDTNYGKKQKD